MSPFGVGVLVLLAIVAAVFIARASSRKPGTCTINADCVAPQECIGGTCSMPTPGCVTTVDCTPPQVCAGGTCSAPAPGCVTNVDCTPPQVCVSGSCSMPASGCSYEWAPWDPSADTAAPAWLVGGSPYFVPVVASTGEIGATPRIKSLLKYGTMFSPGNVSRRDNENRTPGLLYGIKASSACPASFATTTDPTSALHFNNTPVCWDTTSTTGAFTPYANGKCTDWPSWGTFQLVKGS